jgi:hypothetical protein
MDRERNWKIHAIQPQPKEEQEKTMKKKMIVLLAAALLALGASNAMAYFEDYELIRVVYNASTGNEMATDLGNITTLLGNAASAGAAGYTVGGGSNAFTGGTALGSSANANLYSAYFALDYIAGSSTNTWFSSTAATSPNNAGQYDPMKNAAMSTFFLNYMGPGTESVQTMKGAGSNSYQANFDATPGNFAAYLDTLTGEASLATLASGSVSQNLFFWADGSVNGNGVKVLDILTNADGSTTLKATATPIPAAAYLLGSGLMGLLGLRRKQRG